MAYLRSLTRRVDFADDDASKSGCDKLEQTLAH